MQKKQKNQLSFMGGCLKKFGGTSGLIIIIVIAFILGYLGLRGLGAYLIISDKLQPVDAIVILSGGDETRVEEALKLYKENYSRTIILTNTSNNIPSGEYGAVQGSDARIQLLGNGVPGGNILFTEVRVSSTRDEALAIRQMMEDHKLHSCIIVTDPYHSRRALTIFEDIFEKTIFHVYVQPVEDSWYNSRTWFLSLDGWKYTLLEYVKLIAYKFGIILD